MKRGLVAGSLRWLKVFAPDEYRARVNAYVKNGYAKTRIWRSENPDKVRIYHARYRERHKQSLAERLIVWRKEHPEANRRHQRKYLVGKDHRCAVCESQILNQAATLCKKCRGFLQVAMGLSRSPSQGEIKENLSLITKEESLKWQDVTTRRKAMQSQRGDLKRQFKTLQSLISERKPKYSSSSPEK